MMNTITIEQIAKSLRISEADTRELLRQHDIPAADGAVELAQAERFLSQTEGSQELSECRAREYLRLCCANSMLVFDTCALLHTQFTTLFSRLMPLLQENGKRILVPSSVEAELKKLFLQKAELRDRVRTVLSLLQIGSAANVIEMIEDADDDLGDRQLVAILNRQRAFSDAMLVTQDAALSDDALNLNSMASVQGHKVRVTRINQYGYLSVYRKDGTRPALRPAAGM